VDFAGKSHSVRKRLYGDWPGFLGHDWLCSLTTVDTVRMHSSLLRQCSPGSGVKSPRAILRLLAHGVVRRDPGRNEGGCRRSTAAPGTRPGARGRGGGERWARRLTMAL